jgi:molybdopterin molybdotransferase
VISLSEARSIITRMIEPLPMVRVPLHEAAGRVLREDVCAPEDIPAFDRSAMDGYAIPADDASDRFEVVAEIQPGALPVVRIGPGQCARIFTGAAVPEGATQVLMQEYTRRDGEWMVRTERGSSSHIRKRGEDARKGDVLLKAGTRITAGEAALLAQIGAVELAAAPAPRVLHFTTGDELVSPAEKPLPGQIRDSNSTLIATLLRASGYSLLAHQHCPDDFEQLVATIRSDDSDGADVILISGGASVGDYDFGARALEALGFTIHFRKMNLRPGKPLVFATRERQIAFVIPGNPVSHFVTYHLAIRLALECMEGMAPRWPLAIATLAQDLPAGGDGRETWSPARLVLEGEVRVQPIAWQSSGDSCGLVGANALISVPSSAEPTPAGSPVECLWLETRIGS